MEVVDVGGGTGGFAVRLARQGHHVTVVDPSPNALATLERRAAESGVAARISAVQGDAAGLIDTVGAASADLVLCHDVLEFVEDPAEAVAALASVVRPGGVVSVVIAQRHAAVLTRVLAGHVSEARRVLTSSDGQWGGNDPLPRRFDLESLTELLDAAGLRVERAHGARVFTDLVASAALDDPLVAENLLALEAEVAEHPAFRPLAGQLHVLATRGTSGGP
jgi:S-adenosylmethionine-dependent methyltransferase